GRDRPAPGALTVVADDVGNAQAHYRRGAALVEAMAWTRDVSNEPANVIYPETFVERARAAFAGVPGVEITVLDVPAMQRLGMGGILGSGRVAARAAGVAVGRCRGAGGAW